MSVFGTGRGEEVGVIVQGRRSVAATVVIRPGGFDPAIAEVAVGTTVMWTNEDELHHTVSSAEMESGGLEPGGSWTYTFDRPGHYRYFCMLHPHNVGEILVR